MSLWCWYWSDEVQCSSSLCVPLGMCPCCVIMIGDSERFLFSFFFPISFLISLVISFLFLFISLVHCSLLFSFSFLFPFAPPPSHTTTISAPYMVPPRRQCVFDIEMGLVSPRHPLLIGFFFFFWIELGFVVGVWCGIGFGLFCCSVRFV